MWFLTCCRWNCPGFPPSWTHHSVVAVLYILVCFDQVQCSTFWCALSSWWESECRVWAVVKTLPKWGSRTSCSCNRGGKATKMWSGGSVEEKEKIRWIHGGDRENQVDLWRRRIRAAKMKRGREREGEGWYETTGTLPLICWLLVHIPIEPGKEKW